MTTSGGEAGELELLGRAIARARINAGLTQIELGRMLGYQKLTVSTWERGSRSISYIDLVRVCRYCHIDVSELMRCLDNFRPPPATPRPLRKIGRTGKPLRKTNRGPTIPKDFEP